MFVGSFCLALNLNFTIPQDIQIPDLCQFSSGPCMTSDKRSGSCDRVAKTCIPDKIPCMASTVNSMCITSDNKKGLCYALKSLYYCEPIDTGACTGVGNLCFDSLARTGVCAGNLTCITDERSCTSASGTCTSQNKTGFCDGVADSGIYYCNTVTEIPCFTLGQNCMASAKSGVCVNGSQGIYKCEQDSVACGLKSEGAACKRGGQAGVCVGSGLQTYCKQVLNVNCRAAGQPCVYRDQSGLCNSSLSCVIDGIPCSSSDGPCEQGGKLGKCEGTSSFYYCTPFVTVPCTAGVSYCVAESRSGTCQAGSCVVDSTPCTGPSAAAACAITNKISDIRFSVHAGQCAGTASNYYCETDGCAKSANGAFCSKNLVEAGACLAGVCVEQACKQLSAECVTKSNTAGLCTQALSELVCVGKDQRSIQEGDYCQASGGVGVVISGKCKLLQQEEACLTRCTKCALSSLGLYYCLVQKNEACFGAVQNRTCSASGFQTRCIEAGEAEYCGASAALCGDACSESCVELLKGSFFCVSKQCADSVVSDTQLLCDAKTGSAALFYSQAECNALCQNCTSTKVFATEVAVRVACLSEKLSIPLPTCTNGWCEGALCSPAESNCVVSESNALQCQLNCFNNTCGRQTFKYYGENTVQTPALSVDAYYCPATTPVVSVTMVKNVSVLQVEDGLQFYRICDGIAQTENATCQIFAESASPKAQELCAQACANCERRSSASVVRFFPSTKSFLVDTFQNVFVCPDPANALAKIFRFGEPAGPVLSIGAIVAISCSALVLIVAIVGGAFCYRRHHMVKPASEAPPQKMRSP